MHKIRPVDVSGMVEMAAAIAPPVESAFDAALGVGPECLSAEALVRTLSEGITGPTERHLLGCSTCRENLVAFTMATQHSRSDVVANALGKKQERETALADTSILPAIVAVEDSVIKISSKRPYFVCELIPLGVSAESLDVSSIQATGALISNAQPTVEAANKDRIRIRFSNLILGEHVEDALDNNQAVVDTVEIAGRVSETGHPDKFVGLVKIQLQLRANIAAPIAKSPFSWKR